MAYLTLTLFFIFSIQPSIAKSLSIFTSTIHSIDLGKTKQDPHLIKFDNGRVAFVNNADINLVRAFEGGRRKRLITEIVHDKHNNVISAQSLGVERSNDFYSLEDFKSSHSSYQPTILDDYTSASNILSMMRADYNKNGECYSRAHIWAFEEFKRSGLKSNKLFLFFTNRYIRNYRFNWWFHVSPATLVGKTVRVLDRKYAKSPILTKTWTDIFVKSKRSCRLIKYYNTYARNQESQDCYIISVSMYFLIPRDIERRDLYGKIKEDFTERDLKRSYLDAFDIDFKLPEDIEEPESTDIFN